MGGGAHRPVAGPTLVTGALEVLGTHLCGVLAAEGASVRGTAALPSGAEPMQTADLSSGNGLRRAAAGVENVVHLAARVHAMRDSAADPVATYRRINVEGTRAPPDALASADGGTRR